MMSADATPTKPLEVETESMPLKKIVGCINNRDCVLLSNKKWDYSQSEYQLLRAAALASIVYIDRETALKKEAEAKADRAEARAERAEARLDKLLDKILTLGIQL